MLKFLVDESTGNKVSRALRESGYDTSYCGEFLLGYPDEEIIKKAFGGKRVIITNDKDFGEIIFRQEKLSWGVIFLRLKVDTPANRIKYALATIKQLDIQLEKNFVIVSENKIRIRRIKSL